jgi:gliding motility-associated-like protein
LTNSTYTVTGTDLNGCSNSAVSNITVLALPVATFTPSKNNICSGTCITFSDNSTGGLTSWTWNYGDGVISSSQQGAHCYNTPGAYSVSLTVSNGVCSASSLNNQIITVLPSAIADFTITPSDSVLLLSTPLTFSNQSTGATNFLWNFGDKDTSTLLSPSHTYAAIGTYNITLIASNANGCNDTAVRTIRLEYPKNIPNVFSPNNDGKNDLFFLQSYAVTEMQIFNRWGQLVFNTQTNTWDGKTQSGGDAPAGVYYFIAVLKDNSTLKGYVSLVN